jgi:hypothetical protein
LNTAQQNHPARYGTSQAKVDRAGNAQANHTAPAKHLCRPAVTPKLSGFPCFSNASLPCRSAINAAKRRLILFLFNDKPSKL